MAGTLQPDGLSKWRLAGLIVFGLHGALASGQTGGALAERESGIPATNPLVIAKCGTCHTRDDRGNLRGLSWQRTTPEGWQDAVKRMILREGLSLTPEEARAIVKSLSASQGLSAEEL